MSKGKFALGAIFGAVAGVVAGILTAPKSGKETRAEVKIKAAGYKSQAGSMVDDVKTKAQIAAEDAKAEAKDLKARTERAVAGAKKGFFSKK